MGGGDTSSAPTNNGGGSGVRRPVATTTLLRRPTTTGAISPISPPTTTSTTLSNPEQQRGRPLSSDSSSVHNNATIDTSRSNNQGMVAADVGSSVLGWSRMQTRSQLDGVVFPTTTPAATNIMPIRHMATTPPPLQRPPSTAIVSDSLRASIQAVTSHAGVPTPLSQPRKTTLLRPAAPSSSPRPTQIDSMMTSRLIIDDGDKDGLGGSSPSVPQYIRGEKRDRFPDVVVQHTTTSATASGTAHTAASPLPGTKTGTTLLKSRTVAAAARPMTSSLQNAFVYGDTGGVGTTASSSSSTFPQPVFTTSQEEEVLFGKSPSVGKVVPKAAASPIPQPILEPTTSTTNVAEEDDDGVVDHLYASHHTALRPVDVNDVFSNATRPPGSRGTNIHQQHGHQPASSSSDAVVNPYNIPFPFKPYPLQTQAMNIIRSTLEAGHVNRGHITDIREVENQRLNIYREIKLLTPADFQPQQHKHQHASSGGSMPGKPSSSHHTPSMQILARLLDVGGAYAHKIFRTVLRNRSTMIPDSAITSSSSSTSATQGDGPFIGDDGDGVDGGGGGAPTNHLPPGAGGMSAIPIILESPTGTGKTHVLLNSILSWLSLQRYNEAMRLRSLLRKEKAVVRQAILEGREWRRNVAEKEEKKYGPRTSIPNKEGPTENDFDLDGDFDFGNVNQNNGGKGARRIRNAWSSDDEDDDVPPPPNPLSSTRPVVGTGYGDDGNTERNSEVLRVHLKPDDDGVVREEDLFELGVHEGAHIPPVTPKVWFTSRTHTQLQQCSEAMRDTVFGKAVEDVGGAFRPFAVPKSTLSRFPEIVDNSASVSHNRHSSSSASSPIGLDDSSTMELKVQQRRVLGGSDWVSSRNSHIDEQLRVVFTSLLTIGSGEGEVAKEALNLSSQPTCSKDGIQGRGTMLDNVRSQLATLEFYFDDLYRSGSSSSLPIPAPSTTTTTTTTTTTSTSPRLDEAACRLLLKDEDHHAHIVPNAPTYASTPVMPLSFVHITARSQLCINNHIKRTAKGQQLNESCKAEVLSYRKWRSGRKEHGATSASTTTTHTTSFHNSSLRAEEEDTKVGIGGPSTSSSPNSGDVISSGGRDAEEEVLDGGRVVDEAIDVPIGSLPPIPDMEDFTGVCADGASEDLTRRSSGFYCDGCPYSNHSRLKVLRDVMRKRNMTLPQVRAMGERIGACPFIASRQMARAADVVFLHFNFMVDPGMMAGMVSEEPITGLVSGEEDASSALDLDKQLQLLKKEIVPSVRTPSNFEDPNKKNKNGGGGGKAPALTMLGDVVVFDEGHNVVDSARDCLRLEVSYITLRRFKNICSRYLEHYQNRLKPANLTMLRAAVKHVTALQGYMKKRHVANCSEHLLQSFAKYVQEKRAKQQEEHVQYSGLSNNSTAGSGGGGSGGDQNPYPNRVSDFRPATEGYSEYTEITDLMKAARKDPLFTHYELDGDKAVSLNTMPDLYGEYCNIPSNQNMSQSSGDTTSSKYTIGGKDVISHHHSFNSFLFESGLDNVQFGIYNTFFTEPSVGVGRKVRNFAHYHTDLVTKEYQRQHIKYFSNGKPPPIVKTTIRPSKITPLSKSKGGVVDGSAEDIHHDNPYFNAIGFGHPSFGAYRFRSNAYPMPAHVESASTLPNSYFSTTTTGATTKTSYRGGGGGGGGSSSTLPKNIRPTKSMMSDEEKLKELSPKEVRQYWRRRCKEIGAVYTDEEDSDGDDEMLWSGGRSLHAKNPSASLPTPRELCHSERYEPETNLFLNHYNMSSMVEKDRLQVLDDWRRKENTLNDQAFFAVLKLFSVLGSIQSGSHVLVLRDEVPEKFPNNFTPSSNNTRSNSNNAPLGLDRRPAHLKFGTPSQPASFSAVACLGSPSIDEEGGVVETVSASVNRSYAHWLDMPAREYSPTARAQLQHAPKRRVKDPFLRVRCPGGSSRLSLLILPSDVSQLLKPLTKKLRSLVVAGGTLTPLSLTSDPLFGPGNYIVKSFKHIVDVKKNLRLFTVSSSRYAISAKAMPLIRGVGGGSDNDSKREIEFTFTFKTSNKKDELVRAAMNLVFEAAMEVPHGLIVFFPSFMKQDEFWTAVRSVEGGAFFTALNKLKKVFIEEQAGKQQQKQYGQAATNGGGQRMSGDDLLVAYSNYVEGNAPNEGTPEPGNVAPPRTYRGALLSCVMNGKLAEGINFNDHLGRGVIVFGVPYASIKDAELAIQLGDLAIVQRRRQIEENKLKQPQHHRNHHQQHGTSSHTTKIQQLDNAQLSKAILSSEAVKEDGIVADMIFGSSAQDHSSSHLNAFVIRKDVNDIRAGLQLAMAMRAVNQAIGRCIRHKDDYATIFLCDSRYNVPVNTNSTRGTAGQFLPKWMEPAKIMCPGLGDLTNIILPNVQAFFEEKQQYNK